MNIDGMTDRCSFCDEERSPHNPFVMALDHLGNPAPACAAFAECDRRASERMADDLASNPLSLADYEDHTGEAHE